MTVRELRAAIVNCDDDAEVVLCDDIEGGDASDPEGVCMIAKGGRPPTVFPSKTVVLIAPVRTLYRCNVEGF